MPSRRGSSRPFQSRSPKRKTVWSQGPGSTAVTAISASAISIIGSGLTLATESFATITRLRGYVQAYLKTADAVNAGFHCGFGVGIVSSDAFAIGATAIPGPLTDAEWPGWFYYTIFDVHGATATFDGSERNVNLSWDVDSKAQRILKENETVVAMLETVEVTNATMSVFFDSRILFKLS